MNDHNPIALITGASSGIGYELAKIYAKNGHDLLLVARSADKLQRVAAEINAEYNAQVRTIAMDLADSDSAQKLFETVSKQVDHIDVLINNAGFADHARYAEEDMTTILEMIQLNITTLSQLTRLILPGMLARNSGRILNVASIAAFLPGPYMAVYYASKAYVLSFSQALAVELDNTEVYVSALCPGPTATGFQERAKLHNAKVFTMMKSMTAALVARSAYRGMQKSKPLIIPGIMNKLTAQIGRFFSRRFLTKMVRNLQHIET